MVSWFALALFAYVFPNWRHLMIATMIPTIALSFLAFLLPESPKWQLVNGKLDLAEKTVREAMKVQRVQLRLCRGSNSHLMDSLNVLQPKIIEYLASTM